MNFEVNQNKALHHAMEARRKPFGHSLHTPLAEDNPFDTDPTGFEALLGNSVQAAHATDDQNRPVKQDDGATVAVSDLQDPADVGQPQAKNVIFKAGDDDTDTQPSDATLALAGAQQVASTLPQTPINTAPLEQQPVVQAISASFVPPQPRIERPASVRTENSIGKWLTTGRQLEAVPDAPRVSKSHTEPLRTQAHAPLFPEVRAEAPVAAPAPVRRKERPVAPPPVTRSDDSPRVLRTQAEDAPVVRPVDNAASTATNLAAEYAASRAVAQTVPLDYRPVTREAPLVQGPAPVEAPRPVFAPAPVYAPAPVVRSEAPPPVQAFTPPLAPTGPDPRLLVKPDPLPPAPLNLTPLPVLTNQAAPPPPAPAGAATSTNPGNDNRPRAAVFDDPVRLSSLPPLQVVRMINEGVPVALPVVPSVVDRWVNVNGPTLMPQAPKSFQINLAPPDLGPMTIQVTMDAQRRMSIDMTVGSPMVKAALDLQMASIRQIIQVNQFQVGELSTHVVPSNPQDATRVTAAKGGASGKDANNQTSGDGLQRRRPRRRRGDEDLTVGSY